MNTSPLMMPRSRKSEVAAVLLAAFLGPIGLFYASIVGGLIMTFTPVFLVLATLTGIMKGDWYLASWSLLLIIVFAGTYWFVTIIWAVVGVRQYNREIAEEELQHLTLAESLKQKSSNEVVVRISPNSIRSQMQVEGTIEITTKPGLQEWLKTNPGKSINDYYSKFR